MRPDSVTERASVDRRLGSLDTVVFAAKLSVVRNLPAWGPKYSVASLFASVNSITQENTKTVNFGEVMYCSTTAKNI